MDKLEKKIGYCFNNRKYITNALTHSSYANENKLSGFAYNERLDVFKHFPEIPEGELTKLRASVVCEAMLSKKARAMDLGSYLRLGKGEEMTGGRDRVSILADAFEALIGAVYMDGGIENAEKFVLSQLEDEIKVMRGSFKTLDSKTNLQEVIRRTSKIPLEYRIIDEKGPAHNKVFTASVSHGDRVLGTGSGASKKEAEQSAAMQALKNIENKNIAVE